MAEDLPSREILKKLVERLDLLERTLQSNTARLHFIEERLGIKRPPVFVSQRPPLREPFEDEKGQTNPTPFEVKPPESKSSEVTQPPPISEQSPNPQEQKWSRPEAPSAPPTEAPATHSWMNEPPLRIYSTRETGAPTPFSQRVEVGNSTVESETLPAGTEGQDKQRDLESMIGGRWFNWIGIIAVILGVAFFLKFAFDKQWIGPAGRVSIAALLGLALLYLGERLRGRGLKSYAYVLSGGGILILYLSGYAAYSFYHLIGQTPTFLLFAAVTTTAVLLSVRLDALPVAILGLVGGFSTPVLLSTGVDNQVGLFTYVSLLDAGVLAVAYFKRWRSLDFLSFAGTVAITLGWASEFYTQEKVWTTLIFLSIFFLLYSLLAVFHNVLPGRPTRWFDVGLAVANATLYFGFSYVMLTEAGYDQATPASQALLLSVFFTGLFYTTTRWSRDDRLLGYSYVGAAVTFLTVAVAIQFELHWVTIVWAVEGLMLTWVGLRSGEKAARHTGLAVFCAAIGHWFIWDMREFAYSVDPSFAPLLNRRAISCAVLVGAIAGAAWLYKRARELDEYERSTLKAFFALAGNAVALTLLSLDLNDYFGARLSQSGTEQTTLHEQIENTRQFSISALWTLYAVTTLALGVLRRFALLRWAGLLLLLVTIAKVLVLDSTFYAASWHLLFLNQTFMAYALVVAALAGLSWFYGRAANADEQEREAMRPVFLGAASVLALVALSLEVLGYYDRLLTDAASNGLSTEIIRGFQEGRVFTLAIVWTLYATAAFMVGAWRSARAWRWGGLLLLALTTPLVLFNLSYYDAAWHTFVFNRTMAVFAVLVAALWLIVRTYARTGEKFNEASIVRPVATIAANLLAIVALSAQAAGYYQARIGVELGSTAAALGLDGLAEPLRNLELAKQLSLSVVWALYASGLLIVGRLRRLLLLRVMGLALLSLTTLKAFFWDLASLDRVYRVISFIMLGAVLLVVSYFYQRGQKSAEEANITANES